LLLQGKSNKQIALALGVTVRTVEFHLGNIYTKVSVKSRSEAILLLTKETPKPADQPAASKLRESTGASEQLLGDNDEKASLPRRFSLRKMIYAIFSLVAGGLVLMLVSSRLLSNDTRVVNMLVSSDSITTTRSPSFTVAVTHTQGSTNEGMQPDGSGSMLTAAPNNPKVSYCEGLFKNHVPAGGFKLYCDDLYEYAFAYPLGWEVEGLNRPTPDPTMHPGAYPQVLTFFEEQYNNQVYIFTAAIPEGMSLKEIAEKDHAYEDREFKKDYAPMSIGGKPAYGFVNRHVQDYSGATLFFEHGKYYTLMYMKIITRAGLDVNWQIAHSIQTPDTTPADNIISDEFVQDSYILPR